jgi:hypothetical protein
MTRCEHVYGREYRRLRMAITDDAGFKIFTAHCDDRDVQAKLISSLSVECGTPEKSVLVLDISTLNPEVSSVAAACREYVGNLDYGLLALMIVGFNNHLDDCDQSSGILLLQQMNLHRDIFPTLLDAPMMVWISNRHIPVFGHEAGDFLHWRSSWFDFSDVELDLHA